MGYLDFEVTKQLIPGGDFFLKKIQHKGLCGKSFQIKIFHFLLVGGSFPSFLLFVFEAVVTEQNIHKPFLYLLLLTQL